MSRWHRTHPSVTRQLHAGQRRATGVLAVVSLGLLLLGLSPFTHGWHQAFVWAAVIGGPGLLACAWSARRLSQRTVPLAFEVRLTKAGVESRWQGNPSTVIPWSQIRRIMPSGAGFVVVGRGGRSVLFHGDLPELAALRHGVEERWRLAPPPQVETKIALDTGPEPVQPGTEVNLARIARVRGPLGWTALVGFLGGLGLIVGPEWVWPGMLLMGLGITSMGLWVALVPGLHNYLLGVSVVSHALVVQTTYRGWRGRLMAGMWMVAGSFLALSGLLVLLAGLIGASG